MTMDEPKLRPKVWERVLVAPRYRRGDPMPGVHPLEFDPDSEHARLGPRHTHVRAHMMWSGLDEAQVLQMLGYRSLSGEPAPGPDQCDGVELPLDGRPIPDLIAPHTDLTIPVGQIVHRRPGVWMRVWRFECCQVTYRAEVWHRGNRHMWNPKNVRSPVALSGTRVVDWDGQTLDY